MYKTCMLKTPQCIDERNQRKSKWMERDTIFMDWKTQHSRDINSAQIDTNLMQFFSK